MSNIFIPSSAYQADYYNYNQYPYSYGDYQPQEDEPTYGSARHDNQNYEYFELASAFEPLQQLDNGNVIGAPVSSVAFDRYEEILWLGLESVRQFHYSNGAGKNNITFASLHGQVLLSCCSSHTSKTNA